MTQKTPLTQEQIHSISWLSNAAFDLKETSFSQLQSVTTEIVNKTITNSGIQSLIGTWVQIWGPVVYTNNEAAATVVADNTMMLVYNQVSNSFVIGIAGTNAVSMYGWMQEDFNVDSVVTWPSIIGTKPSLIANPCVSTGTNIGLQVLLAMTGPQLTVSGNPVSTMLVALNNYISTNKITGATLATTGHSLGGALAPTLAMYLFDTQSKWNASGNITTISTYPTAGPTPGNGLFADHITNNLGSNYNSYYNTIDVVPQAWQGSTLENIPQIYYPSLPYPEAAAPYSTFIGTMVSAVFLKTLNKNALYIPINYTQATPWNAMTGTFDTATDKKATTDAGYMLATEVNETNLAQYATYFTYLYRFLSQAAFQHTTAYNTLLQISSFAELYAAIKDGIVGGSEEERRQACVHAALAKYFGMPDFTPMLAAKQVAATAEA